MTLPKSQSQQDTRTVLHIDRTPVSAELVEQLISRRRDLKLIKASTGSQCIQLAMAGVPDVIVMEIDVSDMDGVEVVAMLSQAKETSHIPIIALSANAFPSQIDKGMEAGLFCYLTKPFKFTDLMQAIDDALLPNGALH